VALIVSSNRLFSILNLRFIVFFLHGVLRKCFWHLRVNSDEMSEEQQQVGHEDKNESHRSRANQHEGIHLVSRDLLPLHQLLRDHRCNMHIRAV
jgi:hypothetical protein